MRTVLAVLAVVAFCLSGCFGDHVWTVQVRNDTDRSYTLRLGFGSGPGYSSDVPPRAIGYANAITSGTAPSHYTLYDETCAAIAEGPMDGEDNSLVITPDGVNVAPHPAWDVPEASGQPGTGVTLAPALHCPE